MKDGLCPSQSGPSYLLRPGAVGAEVAGGLCYTRPEHTPLVVAHIHEWMAGVTLIMLRFKKKKHFIRKRVESDEKGTKSLKAKSVTTRELFSSLPSDNLIYGRMWRVSVATVFTTHATMLGRYRLQNNCTVYKSYKLPHLIYIFLIRLPSLTSIL